MTELLKYLIASTTVWTGWWMYKGPPSIFFYYLLVVLIVPILFFHFRTIFKKLLIIHAVMVSVAIYQISIGNNTILHFVKVYAALSVVSLFSYYAIKLHKFDARSIFKYYLFWLRIIAVIGVIQFFSYLIDFRLGYDLTFFDSRIIINGNLLRINSVLGEPSNVAYVFAPGFFLAVCRLLGIRPFLMGIPTAILIIFVYIFSQSSTAYIGIFATILILMFNYARPKMLIGASLSIYLVFTLMYTFSQSFEVRMNSFSKVFFSWNLNTSIDDSDGIKRDHGIDGSTFVLFNNLFVAFNNIKNNPVTGSGLGSHEIAFEKYSITKRFTEFLEYPEYNSKDANSLAIRIISEHGAIGILFSLVLFIGCFVKRNRYNRSQIYWQTSGALLTFLIVCYIRNGHYFHFGVTFYMMYYYFNSKNHKQFMQKQLLVNG